MDSAATIISARMATGLFLVLLYAPVLVFSRRRLFPRLSPTCAWMAAGFLAAQALVIIMALTTRLPESPDWWLWDLNREYNIASTLASLQLAMVGGAALMTAGLVRALPAPGRLHLVFIALIFLLLACDEYYALHEGMPQWKRYYAALGLAIAVATMLLAYRSPPRARIWPVCLLAGLAASGTAAILFEELPSLCGNLGALVLDGCLEVDVWEEGIEFLGVWLALAAMLGALSDAAPKPRMLIRLLLYALPALWILPLHINARMPQLELQHRAQLAAVEFESGLRLRGYHIDRDERAALLRLYVTSKRGVYERIGYSARLVDPVGGETIARVDAPADPAPGFWMLPPGDSPLYRHSFTLTIPPQPESQRALWLTIAIWLEQDAERKRLSIRESDHQLLNEDEVILSEVTLRGEG